MSISDFFQGARRRGPRPAPALVVPAAPAASGEVDPRERNLFQSSMGLSFKCGVCDKQHRSSITEKVKGLSACIYRIMKAFGGKEHEKGNVRWVPVYGKNDINSTGISTEFLPKDTPEEAETVRFSYRQFNEFRDKVPSSSFFRAMCPAATKKMLAFSQRLDETLNRVIVEDIDFKEILGAPDSIAYLKARRSAFIERAKKEFEKLAEEQRAADPEMFRYAANWRDIRPEKFNVKTEESGFDSRIKWHSRRSPLAEPIKELTLNRARFSADDVIGQFKTFGGGPFWTPLPCGSTRKVLFDLGLVNKYPAISWGLISARSMGNNKHREVKGYVASGFVNFVTLWNGTSMINMRTRGSENFSLKSVVSEGSLFVVDPGKESYLVDSPEGEENS